MSDFTETWDNMNLRQRIAHLLADWKQSKTTADAMVLRVAATMAHHQLEEADAEIQKLNSDLSRYKRMYCRSVCRDLYSSGLRWRIRENPMRTDGVFIEEDCEPGMNRTWGAFPFQFAHDDAEQIVELLNRAADELAAEDRK